ncbi:hypothetical protein C7H19_19235 [Aphanothece hegewaldii CCALA 016]|uniref:MOSC domain-containing protein n=1 Tax=Aphanothece hegewaldii CCALA 016 TaxID=2107694 RepID=A0A2T1LTM1_9CHRO|nr:MOSC N-terminal beta barrel domain-containing protein [Aphanothece hegewaldii]PSF34265.1 hypothetical protein C7H19_19235 [Aphanothece hegewaldii CCALA 016]
MIVSELNIYPIKSCRGISKNQAEITQKGFLWDREFMLVNSAGKFLTQRQYPQLATVKVEIQDSQITLSSLDQSLRSVTFSPTLIGEKIKVEIWRDRTTAILQDDQVSQWFTTLLNTPCYLVRQSPDYIRSIDENYAPSNNLPVSLADGYPFLITNTASLTELNRRLKETYNNEAQTVSMNRFRPNIVIETEVPFIETKWKIIRIGEIQFSLVKPCTRCIITTTDQITGYRNPLQEPLKTLGTFRKLAQGIMFGENMIPLNLGIIRVGDSIEIIE